MLPNYISNAAPNPPSNRAAWYVNTAPSYAGIFLWIVFYLNIAVGTIDKAPLGVCLAAIAVAGIMCYALYYYAPAMLGMKTGYPLYVVGSSTFGAAGGYVMPGLLMGLLQIGWFAVGTWLSSTFILKGLGMDPAPGTVPFIVVGTLWGLVMGYVGVKGIRYVAKVSLFLNVIPLLMIVLVFARTQSGIAQYSPAGPPDHFAAVTALVQMIIGFFATAGAAGADFGMNSRHEKDVRMGGLVGIALAVLVAAGLPLLSVAGARGIFNVQSYAYDAVIASMGGTVARAMFFLFTLASVTPACFCAFIAGNSFSTMLPGVPRMSSTMAGVSVGILLAVTGVAGNVINVFNVVGASFGPICGAMAADYLLSGRKWAGPRRGVNWAGYIAWAAGFTIGIIPFLPVPEAVKRAAQPAAVYSFAAGFAVYALLAKAGLEPEVVSPSAWRASSPR